MQILKVFAPKAEHLAIESLGQAIDRYDAFVVVQVDAAAARKLLRQYPCEDLSDQYKVRMGGVDVDPLAVTARPRGKRTAIDTSPHHYLVQFVGPVKAAWVRALRTADAVPRNPTGGFSYVVLADAAAVDRIRALPFVRWVGHLQHADRIATVLKQEGPLPVEHGAVTLEVFDGADLAAVAAQALRQGFKVLSRSKRARRLDLAWPDAATVKNAVAQLAAVHGVARIAPLSVPRVCNNVAARIVGQPFAAGPPPGLGLQGEGEIVAVCDTGVDTGEIDTLHPDFKGRVLALKSYRIAPLEDNRLLNPGADDGPADHASGHGTHVAGSLLGDGRASARRGVRVCGMAPKAKLVFQAVEQEMTWKQGVNQARFWLSGLPGDLAQLFDFAYERGARIHNNSWTGGTPGVYDASARQIDKYLWGHKDFAIFVAAGNGGSDTGGAGKAADGRINRKSLAPPGTAKNCITVGACESLRPGFTSQTYGARWPEDYPHAPQRDDLLADDPDTIAAFSARGPTNDGRCKPDVLAPGTLILSTRSSVANDAEHEDPTYRPDPHRYTYMSGTSMATPIAAGSATLLREALRKRHGIASPSAALIKALLVAGCVRLPASAQARRQLTDAEQGFGRIDLQRSLRRVLLVHEGHALHTGQWAGIALDVPAGRRTLRITMAYTDYPGYRLVNNLNLFASGAAGERYLGNLRGESRGGLVLDAMNNVEVIEVPAAAAGRWTLEVIASNVPQGPQDFAIAAVFN